MEEEEESKTQNEIFEQADGDIYSDYFMRILFWLSD
jgi:hypothetical protein